MFVCRYAWRASGGEGFGDTDQPAWKPNAAPGNINLDYYASESPVDMFPWGDSGLYDVVGNVWQWTETPMDALPGCVHACVRACARACVRYRCVPVPVSSNPVWWAMRAWRGVAC